jgi:hypothetical protein
MYIVGATETAIVEAVEIAGNKFGGNLIYEVTQSPMGGYNLSVHVRENTGPGHRLAHPAVHGGRPVQLHSVCWHVWYWIFRHLPADAYIKKDDIFYKVADQKYPVWTEDRGGVPILITELCECFGMRRFPNPLRGEKWQDLYTKTESLKRIRQRVNHQPYR